MKTEPGNPPAERFWRESIGPIGGRSPSTGSNGISHPQPMPAPAGIGMVHQELVFCPDLSIAENLCMGNYPRRLHFLIDRREMEARSRKLLGDIGVRLDVRKNMRTLSTAQEQLVQIAAAVGAHRSRWILVRRTDQFTGRAGPAQNLFALIDRLKSRGVTMIYVSHRMPEIFRLCDRVTVLRDGKCVGTLDRAEATPDSVVRMMIGRSIEAYFPKHLDKTPGSKPSSPFKTFSSPGRFRNITFDVKAGEIVGFAGLVGGAGRSEIAKAVFGLDRQATGELSMLGTSLRTPGRCARDRCGAESPSSLRTASGRDWSS